jgi:hypothetical protein
LEFHALKFPECEGKLMATYYIVADGTTPLGVNEIEAGATISVNDGDVFVVTATADKTTKFELASGQPTPSDVTIEFPETNTSGQSFSVEIKSDLVADISVSDSVDIGDIDIKASYTDGTTFDVGDDASIGGFTGSSSGTDTITIGDRVTVNGNIDTKSGADDLAIGNNSDFLGSVETGAGDDTVTIGSGNTFDANIHTSTGADTFTAGNNNSFNDLIDTGGDADTVTFGDNNTISDFWAGEEADIVNVGFVDSSVAQTIDGVKHQAGSVDDVLRIDVSDDPAGFEQALIDNGYVKQLDGSWLAVSGTDYHIHWNNVQINDFERILICFARGTRIDTDRGEVAVEALQVGDLVRTLDHGFQPIRWIGSRKVAAEGQFAPIRIKSGALGNHRDLLVSPQHRMMLEGWQLELLFEDNEVLVPAKSLVNDHSILRDTGGEVEYFHILFDSHEIIFAEGTPSESFHPGVQAMNSFSRETRNEIYALFPELRVNVASYGHAARRSLKPFEVSVALNALH